jgi:hypothetical protein
MKRCLMLLVALATIPSTFALPTGEFPIAAHPTGFAPHDRRNIVIAATETMSLAVWEDFRVDPNQPPRIWATRIAISTGKVLDTTGIQIVALPASGGFTTQAYLRVRPSGATTVISAPDRVDEAGRADIAAHSLSADGRFVLFRSEAPAFGATLGVSGLQSQVLLRDVVAGTTTLVSAAPGGTPGDRDSYAGAIDGAGDKVVFGSSAANLVGVDPGNHVHSYVRDMVSGAVRMLDVSSGGVPGDSNAFGQGISSDGTKAVFASGATNLPGSPGGCRDGFAVIQPALRHGLELAAGDTATAHRQT